jgi:hypothetical protein
MTSLTRVLPLLAAVLAACSDSEAPPAEDHTPASYSLQVDDVPVSAPYTFEEGRMVRVRIKFFNAAQEDLDDVESSHFGAITFEPTSLASVVRVTGHNYQFDVTGGNAGTGTLQVSYGHDEAADEQTFPAAAVTVTPGPGPAPSQ